MFSVEHLFRRILRGTLWLAALLALALAGSNAWVLWRARDRVYTHLARLPKSEVGVVLGTAPTVGGGPNPFFEGRMNTAARLYHAGKIRQLLLTGDNGHRGYDEPTAMRQALLRRGVPASALHLDYAGFRTLDSMARAGAVFGLREATIVTDDFHLPRALFLAQAFGVEAIGFPSEHVPFRWAKKTLLRETASRVVALLDVYVFHTSPRYTGPKVEWRLASEEH